MSDDPHRKKSMREEVEEYKRRQREAEAAAANSGGDDADPDHDPDDDDPDAEQDWTDDLGVVEPTPPGSGVDVAKIVSNIFLSVGLLLLLVSAGIFWFTRQELVKEISAPGVVTSNILRYHTRNSNDRSRSEGASDLYHAVVEFRLQDGTELRISGTPAINTKVAAEVAERAHIVRAEAAPTAAALQPRKEVPTFRKFAEEFMASYAKANNKPSEQTAKASILGKHLLPAFGRVPLDRIPEANQVR